MLRIHTAEQSYTANHLQTHHIELALAFPQAFLFIIVGVWKHAAVQQVGLFRHMFYTNNPWWEGPSTVNLGRGGNLSWQSISSAREAGVGAALSSVHRANWITHDCGSASRRHAGMPTAGNGGISQDWKWNRGNDHQKTDYFNCSSAKETGKQHAPNRCLFAFDGKTAVLEEASLLKRSREPHAVKFCQ